MKILQHNIQSWRKTYKSVEYFINKENFDVVCLSEKFADQAPIKSNKLFNFNIIEICRPDGYRGVAIALRKNIKFSKIDFDTSMDFLLIKTTQLGKNLIIGSILPPLDTDMFERERL